MWCNKGRVRAKALGQPCSQLVFKEFSLCDGDTSIFMRIFKFPFIHGYLHVRYAAKDRGNRAATHRGTFNLYRLPRGLVPHFFPQLAHPPAASQRIHFFFDVVHTR
jgi:hypothetical protein